MSDNDKMTHDQHYVPKCYLEKWYDSTQHLYGLNMNWRSIKSYESKSCCDLPDLYEFSKGLVPDCSDKWMYIFPNYMEDRYGKLETQAGLFYKDALPLLNSSKGTYNPVFNTQEKAFLKKFLTTMAIRNPNYDGFDESDIICQNEELLKIESSLNEFFVEEDSRRLLNNIVARVICIWDGSDNVPNSSDDEYQQLGGGFYRYFRSQLDKFYLYILASDGKFITSDMPVVLDDDFCYFPLSPDYACLYMSVHGKERLPNRIYYCEDVDKYNSWILKSYKNYIYAKDRNILECLKNEYLQ